MGSKGSMVFMNLVSSSDEEGENARPSPMESGEVEDVPSASAVTGDGAAAGPISAGNGSSKKERAGNQSSSSEGEIAEETGEPKTPSAAAAAAAAATHDGSVESVDPSSTDEDGELDGKAAQRSIRAAISAQIGSAGKDIKERDARFFSLENVVCSHCGTKGHLSYDCPEELRALRCHACGQEGHTARECPQERCFRCNKSGHRANKCTERRPSFGGGANGAQQQQRKKLRRWEPLKHIEMPCYVCGGRDHLDCSLTSMPLPEQVSCANCGCAGHAFGGCHEPRVERWLRVARDMETERKLGKAKKKGAKGTEEERLERAKKESQEFRNMLESKVRSMVGRGYQGSRGMRR